MIAPMPPDRVLTAALVLCGAVTTACDDGGTAQLITKIDALDARVAELERRTTDTGKALEPLAALPNTLEQTQQSLATMKAEQATLVARLTRAEETIAKLSARVEGSTAKVEVEVEVEVTPPDPLAGTAGKALAIGVAQCDDFMSKYAACIEKMPKPARKPMLEALQQMSDASKDVAAGPGRDALAQGCKTADESSKKAFESMGCDW